MYSVEDLLISHGYKLPQHTPSSTPTPTAGPRLAPSPRVVLENRPGHGALNGYERDAGAGPYGNGGGGGGNRPPSNRVTGCSDNNNDARDRSQPRRGEEERGQPRRGEEERNLPRRGEEERGQPRRGEEERGQPRRGEDERGQPRREEERGQPRRGEEERDSRNLSDTHSLGESLTSDSGFCDGPRGPYSQSKDVSYWRRRGQDFTVLLNYADFREMRGGGQAGYSRPEGPQQPRGQEPSAEDRQRAAQERQRWAAQARSREREAALHQWRMAAERKCQSLGNEEWRPAASLGRQLSESEGERWALEQQRLHARTPEGLVVHPRTKAKSQSLPRMLPPESLQYVDMTSSGQELYRRVNGHPPSSHDPHRAPRWPENGRPASASQLSMTPKPRFTRPPRPPSYEVHQQIRGSCEVLSGRDSVGPQARDRTPLPFSRAGDPQLDYYAQESGPPGYIPPPSYKRAPVMRGGYRGYAEIPINYRYRGDVYQQMQMAPDGSHWFSRHPAGSWPDPQRERTVLSRKQIYPGYSAHERPGGGVQYIPFDDPRVRHISSALGGNSLTDADKIRHIRNELPSVTVSEPASDDSAFLPPPLGPFIAAKPTGHDANQTSSSYFDNDNNRWHSDLHKETVDNFPASDQNCNNRYPKNQGPPPSPSSAFQAPVITSSMSCHSYGETITQVKKIVPDSGPENNRNSKRRVSETIFCLVSVPIHTATNNKKDSAADQNNNETIPSLTVTNTDSVTVGHTEGQSLRSKSVTEMPIKPHHTHIHTSSMSSVRNLKRAPLRKEIIDAWALQASEDKELCYAGSWPGDQYRNQETQTSSPVKVVKNPAPQSPPGGPEPGQTASDTTTDSGVGTDNSPSYGYPMAGQKNLHPSSNSAFSRLSLSPPQPPSLYPSQPPPPSPSREDRDQGDQQPTSPKKSVSKPADGDEQVAFGQFLLKPVNRRPWDAIGELECFNKELQDTITKKAAVDQSIQDLDDVHKNILELSESGDHPQSPPHMTAVPDTDREAMSLPAMHINTPNNMKTSLEWWESTTDPEHREMRSAFSRPQARANTRPIRDELSTLPEPGPRDYGPPQPLADHNVVYRQDIPVPQESLLRDVGLTVYTETSGGPGEPITRSLSVPSPLDFQDLCHSMQMSWDSMTALPKNDDCSEHKSIEEPPSEVQAKRKENTDSMPQFRAAPNLNIRRVRSENSRLPRSEGSPRTNRLTREAAFVFEHDDVDERYAIPEPLSYKNESTIADKHLENLLNQEKANAMPAEDLSNLYEVKCAKGIPENESIEQRAARILGISVPVEALGVADGLEEDKEEDPDIITPNNPNTDNDIPPVDTERPSSLDRGSQQVTELSEQVVEEPSASQGQEAAEVEEMGLGVDQDEGEDKPRPSTDHSECEDDHDGESQQAITLDLPEFPPSKLTLSLPITPDEELALSMCCTVEKKGRGGASKLIESLQDKLSSSASSSVTSPGRSPVERMARMKELDSVSRMRRLSLKSSDSGGEADHEERDGEEEEDATQVETEGEAKEEKEYKKDEREEGERIDAEEEHVKEELEEGEQRTGQETEVELKIHEDEGNKEIAPQAEDEEERVDEVQLKTEEAEKEEKVDEVELKTEEAEKDEGTEEISLQTEDEEEKVEEVDLKTEEAEEDEATEEIAPQAEIEEEEVDEVDVKTEEAEIEVGVVELKIEIEEEKVDVKTEEADIEVGVVELKIEIEEEKVEEVDVKTEEAEIEVGVVELKIEIEEEKVEEVDLKTEEAEIEVGVVELKIEIEEEKVEEVDLKTEEAEIEVGVVELKIEEDDYNMKRQETAPEQGVSREEEKAPEAQPKELPKPRQRTMAQKPPLLPKPRSVTKREITLPLSFSSVNCSSTSLEDEELLSDSYDPSRVERV